MPSGGHPPHQLATSFILAFPVATDLFDFAKRIIQDMPDEDRTQGDGCSVGITDGERAVGRISRDADLEGTGPFPSPLMASGPF
jgi:hypothetical protein